ncbi:MAG: RusA family crossover junction endodeoxyribonuclease [Patescibacteria group bacterium]
MNNRPYVPQGFKVACFKVACLLDSTSELFYAEDCMSDDLRIVVMISGVPYARNKPRGDIKAPKSWSRAIAEQTRHLPRIQGPCSLRVTFYMPPDKYPSDLPFGPDLDNYLKRLLDGLNETVFRDVAGHDSCVVHLEARKERVEDNKKSGAHIEIVPFESTLVSEEVLRS